MHSFFCFLYPWMVQTFRYQVPRVLWLKWSPFYFFFLPKIGPKGVWSRGPPPQNLFGFLLSFVNQVLHAMLNSRIKNPLFYRHFCFLGWELWCTTLPSRQKNEILLVALFQTKKWIFEPIELICCSYCWCRRRCQWISSWLQLGYHFRTKKASANSRFHHRHLCNNTRSKNPSFCSCIHLKKCIVMAANQQPRSKKKSIKKITRRKKKSVSKHVNILKAAKKSPPLKKLQKMIKVSLKKCWEPKKKVEFFPALPQILWFSGLQTNL